MLSKSAILEQIRLGNIVIQPFNQAHLNPNSYNVTLNNELLVYTDPVLDVKKNNPTKKIIIPEDGLVLKPNVLYLGRTNEYTETYNLVPCLDGRSSIGRLGLFIHVTAGFGDNGFPGTWTLEIMCVHPVKIYPNIQIGQLYYEQLQGEPTLYTGRYAGQINATPSRLHQDYQQEK